MRWKTGPMACVLLFASCVPSVEKDPPPPAETVRTVALFAPNSENPCESVLPFPSDLARDAETGTVNVPFCPEDDEQTTAIKRGLRTLNGFAVNTVMTTAFSADIEVAGQLQPSQLEDFVVVLNTVTGEQVPVAGAFDQEDNVLALQPLEPLDEETTYIVAVTNELKDADGDVIVSDQAFIFAKSEEPLTDDNGFSRFASLDDITANALEQLRRAFQPAFDALSELGLERDEILVAWAFTTQTVHNSYPGLAALVLNQGGASVTHQVTDAAEDQELLAARNIPRDNLCKVHTGTVTLQSLIGEGGTFAVAEDGTPMVTTEVVDYLLLTPKVGTPELPDCSAGQPEPWNFENIAVFSHALGGCKSQVLAIANSLGQAGWAVLAFDGPRGGERALTSSGDANLDLCPDQPETPELIALPGETTNPFGVRDRLRQWGLEIVQVAAVAESQPWAFAGLDAPVDPPDTTVGLIGHSWGGIATILAGSVTDAADVVAVTAAGAGLGAMFEPLIRANVAAELSLAGLDPQSETFQTMLNEQTQETTATFTWILEPADPLFAAPAYPPATQLPVLVQVISAGGLDELSDPALHDTAAQRRLAAAFEELGHAELSRVTFDLVCLGASDELQPVCPTPESVVGAPLIPCNEGGDGEPDFFFTSQIQGQLVLFVATEGGSVQDAPATPDCGP